MAARKRLASAKKTTATTTAKTSKPGSKSPRRPPKLSVRGVTDIQRYMLRDIAREKKRKPAAKKAPAKKAPAKKAPAKKAPAKKGPAKKAPAKQKPAKQKPAKQVPPARRHARATPNPAIATLLAQEERRAADHQQYIAAAIRNGVTPFQAEINGLNEAQALIRELKRRLYS